MEWLAIVFEKEEMEVFSRMRSEGFSFNSGVWA